MRPTDENQHGSTRPNLMSASRQGGGEDNILAMLERDAGRGRGSQFSSHPRTAWYAGAGALVVAMVGALGWLAWENANKVPEQTVETTLVLPSGETTLAAAHDAPPSQAAPSVRAEPQVHAAVPTAPALAPAHDAPPVAAVAPEQTAKVDPVMPQTAGAAIIDSPAPVAEAPVVLAQVGPGVPAVPEAAQPSRLPPLVLLSPEEAGRKRTPPAAPVPAEPQREGRIASEAATSPADRSIAKSDAAPAGRSAARVEEAPAPQPAAKLDETLAARSGAKADASSRPAVKAKRASVKAPVRRGAKTVAARTKKAATPAAAPAKSQDAGADGDVALISAIIMHSSRHAAERAKAEAAKGCDGDKCPAKAAVK